MKERLIFEASMLSRKQHMASLIIDEAAIKPKCVYDRKADTVFGLKDKPDNSAACSSTDTLANRVLCFVRHDTVIFLSFDPCHILKNVRSQFLERELTDGKGVITGKFVQKLYEYQKDKTVKLARNLTRKHVYPSNLEKMNVLRAVQTFSLQVTEALSHLQENRRGDPALYSFREVTPTILFMKMMKQWFDIHDTVYSGSENKRPISEENDPRMVWLEKDFTCYVKNVQEASIASGKGELTSETYHALLFTTKATVEATKFLLGQGIKYVLTRNFNSDPVEALFGRLRSMCGGNDVLDAKAVTIALDNIVKEKAIHPRQVRLMSEIEAEELAAAVPLEVTEQLENLKGHLLDPSPSVTYSGLVYVGAGYLRRLLLAYVFQERL
ncbi:hypothetical protein HPB52_000645 [Rhipicephalus sanguineus]|uniref:Transposable element P transposase-like GTP-binding insertion domain-containing protein n=1 Tax=Rhipicephalus sanguineus TaxID=34632 RepID=A0A9D4STG1_RHISA|nr:hypothetical protein HPB52_000645 [Rhipicephalus sanguineus]